MSEKRHAQQLTKSNKDSRLDRCKKLLRKFPEESVDFLLYTDEKVFQDLIFQQQYQNLNQNSVFCCKNHAVIAYLQTINFNCWYPSNQ